MVEEIQTTNDEKRGRAYRSDRSDRSEGVVWSW